MPGWNLALRFGLEASALIAFGIASWKMSPDQIRWIAVVMWLVTRKG